MQIDYTSITDEYIATDGLDHTYVHISPDVPDLKLHDISPETIVNDISDGSKNSPLRCSNWIKRYVKDYEPNSNGKNYGANFQQVELNGLFAQMDVNGEDVTYA